MGLAAAAPDLRFIVQDQANPVAQGQARLPHEMKERISFQVHDFFKENPVEGPSAFMLRFILHDWPDVQALEILRGLTVKMTPEKTKLIIVDTIVRPPEQMHFVQRKSVSKMDLTMRTVMNSGERTQEEWEQLVEKADPLLQIQQIKSIEGSDHSIIEVVKRAS
jgi:6-hydroxytryprostatin B O-methyltransferase